MTAVPVDRALDLARRRHSADTQVSSLGGSGVRSRCRGVLEPLPRCGQAHRYRCIDCLEIFEVSDMEASL